MKMINKASGEAVYFNPVTKAGKEVWVIQGIGSTVVIGRDRQKRKSRPASSPNTPRPRLTWPGTALKARPIANDKAKTRKRLKAPHRADSRFRLSAYLFIPPSPTAVAFFPSEKRGPCNAWKVILYPQMKEADKVSFWPGQGPFRKWAVPQETPPKCKGRF